MSHLRQISSLALALALVTSLGAACAPPPFALATEGTTRDPVGSISAGGYASYAGDFTSATSSSTSAPAPQRTSVVPSGALGARVTWQMQRNLAIGGEAAGGMMFGDRGVAGGLGGGRFHVRLHPDSDHFAFVAGLGGGVGIAPDSSRASMPITARYNTSFFGSLDLGARVGTRLADRVDIYASETIAFQLIGISGQRDTLWMFHTVTEVGAIARVTRALGVGAHLSMAFRANDNGAMDRPAFIPSLSARYTFDAPR